ncbi:MAG: pyridoxal 5'-phosphate synthase glutaminase subunit PdxT [Anaerolineales bacterium]|nr:pyridoxal 5'-phosphate synthase glutaminase subunit PdxT [Anaerolineales bacterium]
MTIGVLALQGDFEEHIIKLSGINVPAVEVRRPADLASLSGLIIPGGETTTFRNLAQAYGLVEPLQAFGRRHAVWGTCAGAIALASDLGREQSLLGLMDIAVERNAFGRQLQSFEIDLEIPTLPRRDGAGPASFPAVFIRAPAILRTGRGVEILARLPDGTIVAARQRHWLATCFHPELTGDDRLHRLFLDMVACMG